MSDEISYEVDGGTLAALDCGGTRHPVLLVHGSGHNAAAWTAVAAELLPGHRVIAVDLAATAIAPPSREPQHSTGAIWPSSLPDQGPSDW